MCGKGEWRNSLAECEARFPVSTRRSGEGGAPRQPAAAPAEGEPRDSADLSFAKWLIPTFGVLFALVGYTVRSAHSSLLGFPVGEESAAATGGYTADAADFLRYVLTVVGDGVLSIATTQGVPIGGHGLLLAACAAVLALAIALPRSRYAGPLRERAALVLVLTVLAIVSVKFVVFDAPLSRIENAIVGEGVAPSTNPQKGAPETQSLLSRLRDQQGGRLEAAIAGRAGDLFRLLVCGRVAQLPNNPEFAGDRKCAEDTAASAAALHGEFNAILIFGLLIGIGAWALLRQRTPAATAVGLLAFAYLLTIPYAYGKLVKPVDFAYALVRIDPGSKAGAQPVESNGFLISRSGADVTLLAAVDEDCSNSKTVKRRALRFSSLPLSKVVSIERIYLRDVLTWAVLNEVDCPALDTPVAPAPPPGG
jgi:hypothetical protein